MNKNIVLTTHTKRDSKYDNEWFDRELSAYKDAGFDIETIEPMFLFDQAIHDDDHFKGKNVLVRCYSEQERKLEWIIRRAGGNPIIPNMDTANDWYRNITWGTQWYDREISHSNTQQFGYLDDAWQMKALRKHLDLIFDYFGRNDKVFFKSSTKHNLTAGVRTKAEAYEDISYWLALACHNRLETLIFSNPIELESNNDTIHGKEEYRVFIVGDKVSTVSLFSDKPKSRDYTRVIAFAQNFANRFCNFLPLGYCLDVAITAQDKMVVVELNGIGASGFYADHDLNKLFSDMAGLVK